MVENFEKKKKKSWKITKIDIFHISIEISIHTTKYKVAEGKICNKIGPVRIQKFQLILINIKQHNFRISIRIREQSCDPTPVEKNENDYFKRQKALFFR